MTDNIKFIRRQMKILNVRRGSNRVKLNMRLRLCQQACPSLFHFQERIALSLCLVKSRASQIYTNLTHIYTFLSQISLQESVDLHSPHLRIYYHLLFDFRTLLSTNSFLNSTLKENIAKPKVNVY